MQTLDAFPGFKFGADPELFVMNKITGEYVCPAEFIPGTKTDPYKVDKGAVQLDGMSAEFNIDPAESFQEFNDNTVTVLRAMTKMLPKDHALMPTPSVVFSEAEWDKAPEYSKELGCSPDFNAWTGMLNPPPERPEGSRMCCAGGHLHFGWTEDASLADPEHVANGTDLVKQLDWYLGGWSLRQDKDPVRRRLYGKAGACRFKPYGVEYRVLSNFWVSSVATRRAVWNRMQQALLDMRDGFMPEKFSQFNPMLIQSIDTSSRNSKLERDFPMPLQFIS